MLNATPSMISVENVDSKGRHHLIEMPLDVIIYGSLFYPIIFLIGVAGNLLVIYVLFKEKQLRSFTNYLLANLSFADLMVLFTCVPGAFHDLYAKERWYLGKIACYVVVFVENCMTIASMLSIFMIMFERYYVICRPLVVRSMITRSHILKLITIIWLLSFTTNLPYIYLTEYKLGRFRDTNNSLEYKCFAKSKNQITFYYIIFVNLVVYFLIGIILLYMYHKIAKYLKNSHGLLITHSNLLNKNRTNEQATNKLARPEKITVKYSDSDITISNAIVSSIVDEKLELKTKAVKYSNNNLHQSTSLVTSKFSLSNNNLDKYIIPRRQLMFMLTCICIIFYVCLLPLKLWTVVLLFVGHHPNFTKVVDLRAFWYINVTTRIFFFINSSINPILYNFLSQKFRHSFSRLAIFKYCNIADRAKMKPNSSFSTDLDDKNMIAMAKISIHMKKRNIDTYI